MLTKCRAGWFPSQSWSEFSEVRGFAFWGTGEGLFDGEDDFKEGKGVKSEWNCLLVEIIRYNSLSHAA